MRMTIGIKRYKLQQLGGTPLYTCCKQFMTRRWHWQLMLLSMGWHNNVTLNQIDLTRKIVAAVEPIEEILNH